MPTDADLVRILRSARTIAVLGAHHDPSRPAFYVPEYLHQHGHRVLPVNPALVGRTLFGEPVRATLAELPGPVDLVDVFRRGDLVPGHLDDLFAMSPLPRVVWLQLGVRSEEAAHALEARGVEVVQDRCTLAEHRRLGLGDAG